MINILNIQPNQPKAILSEYFILCYGVGKAGKTTLFYKLAQSEYIGGLDKALLVAFEEGYKALNGIHAVSINEWKDFIALVDQLVEHREQITYKWIGLDTLDYLYQYATDFVVKRERIAKKDAKIKAIGDIAWGAGYQMVADEVDKQIKRLQSIGLGIFAITHDKEKKIELKNGQTFDKTTVTLPEKAKNLFVNMSDFIIYISINKEVSNGSVLENRYIHFRSDGDIEAGSRFENVPDKIEYDVDLFVQTFEKAVLASYDGDTKAVAQAKVEQEQEREEKVKDYIQAEKQADSPESLVAQIDEAIKGMSKEQTEKLKAELKAQIGSLNYKKYEVEDLTKAIALVNTILSA
jgi:GTPase SAR1 family protein